jgi:hypothetical protein
MTRRCAACVKVEQVKTGVVSAWEEAVGSIGFDEGML